MKATLTRIAAATACLALLGAATAFGQAQITQKGNLRLTVNGKLSPSSLPRKGAAPIAVSVNWSLATTDATPVPKLKKLKIEINRHGHFDSTGLPVCKVAKIQTASSSHALAACRHALVGQGSFSANVALQGQVPYDTGGHLLVFNGKKGKKQVLLGQIYSPHPFPTSFVIDFAVKKLRHGAYGTSLNATLPRALSAWGNLTGIKMRLSRRFGFGGRRHSYVSAGCPAPKGFSQALFPLARTSFSFAGGRGLKSVFTSSCRARGR